ncbi:MAG: hypothetical protein ACFFCZ_19690 [Promethearchaeota archaeon]
MGVHLVDLTNKEHRKKVNWWNWRPTLELIRKLAIIDDTRLHLMDYNATRVIITKKEAQQIGKRFQADILSKIEPGQRILLDQSVTSEPEEQLYLYQILTDVVPSKFYIARYEWLVEFTEFCLNCEGFTVI